MHSMDCCNLIGHGGSPGIDHWTAVSRRLADSVDGSTALLTKHGGGGNFLGYFIPTHAFHQGDYAIDCTLDRRSRKFGL